ncbi:amidohydrolase [Pseudomassariella vexata]|uniref:Amidohydrolase n=1 Tax=Pseudomassariella vexata TaxID=1141098 RepID=A0A1Y2E3T9_9PEZI|nr:amidohydrolase [Pseudomassariella vexata]ORY65956.1 amidohydrolase [Pseudomassariella vexata]
MQVAAWEFTNMTRRILEQQPAARASPAQSSSSPLQASSRQIFSTGFGIAIRSKDDDDSVTSEDVAATKKTFYTIIKAGLLIPGDGEPLEDGALVIENKLIAWVGAQGDIPEKYTDANHRSFSVPFLMPGLWECHAHFAGIGEESAPLGFLALHTEHPAACGARLAKMCWESLQRGYTSVRDMAGYGCEVAQAVNNGAIVGPNIYSAGAGLSQLAGHGDIFNLPAGDVLSNLGVSNSKPGQFGTGAICIVDGVDECRRGVRLQIRRGAKCIKIMASGGVMSLDDNPLYAQFCKDELDAIVEEATRMNRAVAAHVHGKPGIIAAVNAGVTTIEHVSYADQECIDLIKEKGTVFIATRTVVEKLLATKGKGLPKKVWEKAKLVSRNAENAYKLAIKAGIPCALGTDTDPGFNQAVELEYAVQAGMSNLEAIKAATANGPLTVGGQAPKSGQLKTGYEADILGLTENPVEDVKVLQKKDVVEWVWKGGKIFKGPGIGPWGEDYVMD